jgi:hypothetical protein
MYIPAPRDPLVNDMINPLVYDALNPLMNNSLNPLVNEAQNPLMNDAINPLVNKAISPLMNESINYLVNDAINPLVNDAINPLVNDAINPLINRAYPGLFFFTMHGTPAGFGVAADDGIVVLFSESLNHAGTAVPVGEMLMIFDTGNRWIGYLVPTGSGGYTRFDITGHWVGYAH